ncbi:hypothetical protein KC347_g94 [Hortaea werneckii]|nr:hypothetical protein KC347_g94 [Hortaea werneckii]
MPLLLMTASAMERRFSEKGQHIHSKDKLTMTYEVIARVCGHAVRATSSNLDYCTACRNSRRIREERDRAEMEASPIDYDRIPPPLRPGQTCVC